MRGISVRVHLAVLTATLLSSTTVRAEGWTWYVDIKDYGIQQQSKLLKSNHIHRNGADGKWIFDAQDLRFKPFAGNLACTDPDFDRAEYNAVCDIYCSLEISPPTNGTQLASVSCVKPLGKDRSDVELLETSTTSLCSSGHYNPPGFLRVRGIVRCAEVLIKATCSKDLEE